MNRMTAPFTITLMLAAATASAGLQDDAKVAVHAVAHATKGGGCADPALTTTPCSQYTTEWTLGNTADVYLVVAQADPAAGIAGLSCGVDYSAANLFVAWTLCADGLHFPSDGGNGPWPAPGGGNRMTWATCQSTVIGEDGVHAVAGFFYVYSYGEDRFQITPNNVIQPPELQVTACNGEPSDLPESALGSVYMGSSQPGVNPCGASSQIVTSTALSDIPVAGTVSGSYLDTRASDDVREILTERESGGKKSDRTSYAEHRWSFEIPAGTGGMLSVEASRPDNPEGDDFVFEVSTNGTDFVPVLTVNSAVEQVYSGALPPGTAGTVLVRAVDTDQTAGNRSLDSVAIDHLFIETTTTSGPPPAAPVMHVSDIGVTRHPDRNRWFARAEVTVVDQDGSPVAGALVSGSFNAPNPGLRSGTTGGSGVAVITSQATRNAPANWCFQVADVVLEGATYDPASNQWTERCEDGSGSASGPMGSRYAPEAGEQGSASARPNPLRSATEISFSVREAEPVTLEIFNVSGQRVAVLADGVLAAGTHTAIWDASRHPAGLYFYRLTRGRTTESHKLLLLE